VRLYILSVGPADQDMEWSEDGVEGWGRFLRRVWRIGHEVAERAPAEDGASSGGPLERAAHRAIAEATQDIEQFKLNTATAEVRKLVNEIAPDPGADGARFAMEIVLSLIQPYAPHIAEELWSLLGRERLWAEPWPEADPALLQRDTFELVVQVNGRVRDRLQVASDLLEDELIAAAKASPRVRAHVDGREIRQTIVVPQKLVNLVLA
jgi:leucyl-tRNA synthetase